MHKLNYFPLGNADCTRVDLENGRKLLIDFADTRDPSDPKDRRCDLPTLLREDLEVSRRDYFDAVVFTHRDKDHYDGASEFFFLEHAKAYQSGDRIKMLEMWVPAGFMIEPATSDSPEEGRILRQEARYRFREMSGIRVFGNPSALKDYCEDQGISLDERRHLITDAGSVAPGFSIEEDGMELFVHSPFAWRIDGELENRNANSVVLQGTFVVGAARTRVLFTNDVDHEALGGIIRATRRHANEERLEWDVAKVPHHCSYLSIGPERGETITAPQDPDIDWLYREQQVRPGLLISTSWPIPSPGADDDNDQPPHRQAAAYYRDVLDDSSDFRVTMEEPTRDDPKPIIVEIDDDGPTLRRVSVIGAPGIITRSNPRAG